MVAQILEECQNANDETFIDLGSGNKTSNLFFIYTYIGILVA